MVLEQSAQGVTVLTETPTGEAKPEILLEVSVEHVAE